MRLKGAVDKTESRCAEPASVFERGRLADVAAALAVGPSHEEAVDRGLVTTGASCGVAPLLVSETRR